MDTGQSPVNIPTLVVVGYDRPNSLKRLLFSLSQLHVEKARGIPLIISLDGNNKNAQCVADEFTWSYGTKRIIVRKKRLGLREHILACGDLAMEYGSIILLEDDSFVSPYAYQFAIKALDFYREDSRLAGISLYSYRRIENTGLAFMPLEDGFDSLFIRFPSSRGQIWTGEQWKHFRTWYADRSSEGVRNEHGVPAKVVGWSEQSWKKYFLRYMIETDRYFVYPRVALSTNCGDPGTNYQAQMSNVMTPLDVGVRNWRFSPLDDNAVRYDSWFEPEPHMLKRLYPRLAEYDFCVNLHSEKADFEITSPFMLSSQPCSDPIESFPCVLIPLALNLGLPGMGDFFYLGKTSDFRKMPFRRWLHLVEVCNGESRVSFCAGVMVCRTLMKVQHMARRLLYSQRKMSI